jgi:hypothetical protein
MKISVSATIIKSLFVASLFFLIPDWHLALVAALLLTLAYQYVIGFIYGVVPFPALDLLCMLAYDNGRP